MTLQHQNNKLFLQEENRPKFYHENIRRQFFKLQPISHLAMNNQR